MSDEVEQHCPLWLIQRLTVKAEKGIAKKGISDIGRVSVCGNNEHTHLLLIHEALASEQRF